MQYLIRILTKPIGTVIIPFIDEEIESLRTKLLAQDHTTTKWQSQDLILFDYYRYFFLSKYPIAH